MDRIEEIRVFFKKLLALRGDRRSFSDQSSLFLSGRLGSVEAVEVVVLLEEKFGIDFTETGFDETQIDSIDAIQLLIRTAKSPSRAD
jgi:acyl carrier protein